MSEDVIEYRIFPKNPGAHLFEVSCTVASPAATGQRFSLPAWIPGSYMIREFARNIVWLRAESGGKPITIEKTDKDTWQCEKCDGPLTLVYEVYAWDLSVRAAHLDTTHGFFNGTSVFVLPEGKAHFSCVVDIAEPADIPGWQLATALTPSGAKANGFGRYMARDYDELIDHPVEMGTFSRATFTACGTQHDIVITGRHRADLDRLCADLQKICEYHIRFFGEPAPFERYVFLVMAVNEGYGGLEHRASTSLLCSRDDLPQVGEAGVSENYRTFLGLCSHEYFHAWNVKCIKPAAFLPYDLSREAYTRQLWAFEGITSYYDDLALLRCGLIDIDTYLQLLGETATRVWRGSGRLKQTVAESSFDAWTKFYRQDENAPNAIVSYYTKGSLIALALDLTIRAASANRKSLDDVMRALWQQYGQPQIGVAEQDVERVAMKVTNLDLHDFFDQALRTTDDLPLQEILALFGVKFNLRAAQDAKDKGGKPVTHSGEKLAYTPDLGIRLVPGAEAKLSQVLDDGAAQKAGLSAGDVIVAVDGLRASGSNLEKMLASHRPGSKIQLHVFRRDELMVYDVELLPPVISTCFLTIDEATDTRQKALRNEWLRQFHSSTS